MFLKRSVNQILTAAAERIAENTPITNFHAGSIARSIVEAMAYEIGTSNPEERPSLYDFAQEVLDQGFLSKASGIHLDLIGGLFSYPRRIEEFRDEDGHLVEDYIDDDLYRYEISQIVPSMATANYAALRLALLTVQGVKDVVGKEYTHGTGSFSFIVLPMYGFEEEEILANIEQKINETKAYGVRPNIITSVKVPVDLTIKLFFHESVSEEERANTRILTENAIRDYLGLHELGQSFIYNDLVQEIMNVNEQILDFEITRFYMNNEPVLLTNHNILDDEEIIPQNIEVI